MRQLRIGIIGAGATIGISQAHVRAYSADDRARLTAVYDVVRSNAEKRAAQWGLPGSAVCTSLEDLFSRIDLVSICTPNSTHVELIVKALEAGKHLLCEKPLARSWEEANEAVKAAESHPDLVAMVGFNYRDIPALRAMKELIDAGTLGRVYTCRIQMGGSRIADPTGVKLEWRMQRALSGSGSLADFGCHVIDIVDHLLGPTQGKIRRVHAFAETFITRRKREAGGAAAGNGGTAPQNAAAGAPGDSGAVTNDDSAVLSARTDGGTLISSIVSRVGMPRFMIELVGEGGMALFSGNHTELEVWQKPFGGPYPNDGRKTVTVEARLTGRDEHRGLVQDLLTAAENGGAYERGLRYGQYVQGILESFERSLESGGAVTVGADGRPA